MRPINSIKHIVDASGALSSTSSNNAIAVAVPNLDPDTFSASEVRVGSTINAFFIIVNVIGGATVTGSIDWYLIQQRTGQAASIPTPGATGLSTMRNQIIHEEKGVPGTAAGTPHIFKGVIVVPRGIRRVREGDSWRILLKTTNPDTGIFCVKVIYKSFF